MKETFKRLKKIPNILGQHTHIVQILYVITYSTNDINTSLQEKKIKRIKTR